MPGPFLGSMQIQGVFLRGGEVQWSVGLGVAFYEWLIYLVRMKTNVSSEKKKFLLRERNVRIRSKSPRISTNPDINMNKCNMPVVLCNKVKVPCCLKQCLCS